MNHTPIDTLVTMLGEQFKQFNLTKDDLEHIAYRGSANNVPLEDMQEFEVFNSPLEALEYLYTGEDIEHSIYRIVKRKPNMTFNQAVKDEVTDENDRRFVLLSNNKVAFVPEF